MKDPNESLGITLTCPDCKRKGTVKTSDWGYLYLPSQGWQCGYCKSYFTSTSGGAYTRSPLSKQKSLTQIAEGRF
jgi:hypothetical protein